MKILKVNTIANIEKELVYFSKRTCMFLKLYKEQIPQRHHVNGPVRFHLIPIRMAKINKKK